MKKKWMSNWGLKLISIVFAIILWLVVVNVDDPVITKKIKNIPVKILNEDLISDEGKIYSILDDSDVVSITIKAKRSVAESLSADDFKATADMSERISETSIPIKVEALKRARDIDDIVLQNNTVKIEVEAKINKEIPVKLVLSGKTADGYTVGKTQISPAAITVEGPESVVTKISRVIVPIDINGASGDLESVSEGQLVDENDELIEDERIEGDISHISVNVHMLHTKSIDLNLMTEGEPADDYRCQDIQYTPTTIMIAGEPEDLEKINTLVIPSFELNIQGATQNIVKEIDVTKYLPSGLILCNENDKKIQVTLVIQELDGKEFNIPVSSVDVLNTPSGLDTVFGSSRAVSVIIKGDSQDLNNLSQSDIKLSVDVKNKAEGTYNLQANVTVPSGYVVMNNPMVSITLRRTVEGSQTPVQTQTQAPGVPSETQVQTYNPQKTHESGTDIVETPVPTPTLAPIESVEPSENVDEETE